MRTIFHLAAGLAAATSVAGAVMAQQQATTGNGAPSGSHYSLNIIGVAKDKSSNPDWASGHVIFGPREKGRDRYHQDSSRSERRRTV
jgi:hypothetical protein